MRPPADEFAKNLDPKLPEAVRKATAGLAGRRKARLDLSFDDVQAARREAGAKRAEMLRRLPVALGQFEEKCRANGIQVHRAADGEAARRLILDIVARSGPEPLVVKGKSMATEEIHLNQALEEAGVEVVETDLGEFVIQLDHDIPSHIVAPIIHRTRQQVGETFRQAGLGDGYDDPQELTRLARTHLREKFQRASVGITGVNFAVLETGRLVIVENEGNNRLCSTAPRVHIAVMGIEKLIEREADLPLFLKLLAGSATGQGVTVYTHFISGPRQSDEADGPDEVHLVLLDNGRSRALNGPLKDILRCIRCGACLNVCPIFRSVSGHGYFGVYSGPMGAVLQAALEGVDKAGHLAKASTLCGACEEVCPVSIPFTELLLRIRAEMGGTAATRMFGAVATDPRKWRSSLQLLPMAGTIPGWSDEHETPSREGRSFRAWWKERGESLPETRSVFREAPKPVPQPSKAPETGWKRFRQELEALGGEYREAAREADALEGLSTEGPAWEAECGVDHGLAIAETGSVLVDAGGSGRLRSLAPPISVLFVRELTATLAEGLSQLSERSSVLITGPSRTADIEGQIVRGVHGPIRLIVVRLTESPLAE